jgi:hypothetical protein
MNHNVDISDAVIVAELTAEGCVFHCDDILADPTAAGSADGFQSCDAFLRISAHFYSSVLTKIINVTKVTTCRRNIYLV